MEKNIGTQDSHMRLAGGVFLVLFALYVVENPTLQIILAVISAILAGTAFLHICMLYKLFGINTCKIEEGMSQEETELPSEEPAEDSVVETPAEELATEEVSTKETV